MPVSTRRSSAPRSWPTGYQKTRDYRTPRMPWGLNTDEIPGLRAFHPNILEVASIERGRGRGFVFGYKLPLLRRLGLLGTSETTFVRLRFGTPGATS